MILALVEQCPQQAVGGDLGPSDYFLCVNVGALGAHLDGTAEAHLAGNTVVWLHRSARARSKASPVLTPADPAVLAAKNDYAHSDANVSLTRFRERRTVLLKALRSLAEDEWQWVRLMSDRPLMLVEQAAFVGIHDGYHIGQVAQWLAAREGT